MWLQHAYELQSFPPHSSTFCSKGYAVCVAGEEPPLAGALRCAPRNHREHPSHGHPFLYGHAGRCVLHLAALVLWAGSLACFSEGSSLTEGTFCSLAKSLFNPSCNFVVITSSRGMSMKIFVISVLETPADWLSLVICRMGNILGFSAERC